MAKTRVKRAAETVRVPQSVAEAETMIARIGELVRARQLRQSALDEVVAAAKQKAELEDKQPAAELTDLQRGLQLWADANRETLTDGRRTKTVKLATGEIAWRTRPPSVRLAKVEAVIEAINGLQLADKFLRVKTEVNKEALLAHPIQAAAIAGVSIASAGEDFVVTPTGLEMAGGAA